MLTGEGKAKFSLFANMIMYLENSKDSTGLEAWLDGKVLAAIHEALASLSSIETNPTKDMSN